MLFVPLVAAALVCVQGTIVQGRSGLAVAPAVVDAPCPYVADVAQVVDVSWSENDNSEALKSDANKILGYAGGQEDWRLALTSFIDKPLKPLGWLEPNWQDFCFKLNAPLGSSMQTLQQEIDALYLAGGYDFPEAQLEGLYRAAISDEIGWRGDTNAEGKPVQRVIVVYTDSIAHYAGDAADAANKLQQAGVSVTAPTENNLTPGDMTTGGPDVNCVEFDYPSLDKLKAALLAKNIIPVFIVAPPTYACGTGLCVFPEMQALAESTGNPMYADPTQGNVVFYTELLKTMDVTGIVVPMGSGFEGVGDAFVNAMIQLGTIPAVCVAPTTTPAPTSTPPSTTTTPAPTTTPIPTTTTPAPTTTTSTPPPTTVGTVGSTVTLPTTLETTTPVPTTTTPVPTTTSIPTTTPVPTTTPAPTTTASTLPPTTVGTVGSTVTLPTTLETTTPVPTTTTPPDNCEDDCTVKIDLMVEKCDGQTVTQSLVV